MGSQETNCPLLVCYRPRTDVKKSSVLWQGKPEEEKYVTVSFQRVALSLQLEQWEQHCWGASKSRDCCVSMHAVRSSCTLPGH